ncbi:uncharacterized protein BO96DRAFT_334410 [Aspergillus niger CBS 101883]|uniref:uncharacterized protein n=1 Tax=Aspergillus lacticoffeatus (strain CBS 101883) TaxID=1450533 RepID=UPI000D7F2BA6|nr:uncharacterized protein BO96DRAFT_334410 [Aspergillus niger CBS 101883]PYH57823.1 hypothetical protein BO96DRAFT_334410 [Aspergillus niger CBS 101883]
MFERNADIAVSPLHSIPVISGKGKLPKRSFSKGAHSGNSGGEIAEYNSTSPETLPPSPSYITTIFYLAYPPPHSSSPFRQIKPRLLLQLLQQAARKNRLHPVFEVLLTAPVGLQNYQKEVRCRSGDIALVHGDYYSDCTLPDGSRARYSGDEEDEDERAGKIKVLAVIRDQRKIHARRDHLGQAADNDSGPVRFFFSCGAIWEVITAQNGKNYQLVAVDPGESTVNGDLKLISWTRECPSHENGGNETRRDIRFRLSIVNGDFQELPIVATATIQSIQIMFQPRKHDDLKSPPSCRPSSSLPSISRERAQLLTTRDNPFSSLDVSISEPLYLLCLVITSAVWVASSEGWLIL